MQITLNQALRWAKKLFKLWQRHQAKQKKQQHQQQQQQQHGGSPYGAPPAQQGQYESSPYPQTHGQQQQHGAWNQAPAHGGYGAHDGPATVRLASLPRSHRLSARPHCLDSASNSFSLGWSGGKVVRGRHAELAQLLVQRWSANEANKALRRERRLTPTPFLPTCIFTASPNPRRPALSSAFFRLSPIFPSSSPSFSRSFSTTAHFRSRPFRPPPSFYDPSSPYSHPSYRGPPTLPSSSPTSPPPLLHVFLLLPSYLRPSYHVILRLLGLSPDSQNQDMANAQNSEYVSLRNQAIREGDLMGQAFSASKQAYAAGDGARAHELSLEGKEHQRNKERYNDQAAAWIFNENNKVQPPGSIDLHGLYVQEAIEYTEKAIMDSRSKGMSELRVIVGKGNHSPSHVAKIKPAITQLMERERLTAHLDPHNGGVLVVQLQGQGGGKMGGQFMREMEDSRDNDCVVM
ncbi:uncharacterized protein JCM10292_005595 [Rhodotorula paludigena]|uniref:uncharacterized protein n=1 Tax=Rhodotorula paludigena TaxID=86838 RepID=UPI003181F412